MHDIDRTLMELEEEEEFEEEFEGEFEGEYELEEEFEGGFEGYEAGRVLSDTEEMELASDLLSISSEDELEQFLGKVFKKVASKAGKFLKSSTGRALSGVLKGVAKKALPIVGGALGSAIPIPGVGTAIGSSIGSALSNLFELELEGMSPEDQEFEVARRVVRIAAQSAANATKASKAVPAAKVAKAAILAAAKKHAPGLIKKEFAMPRYYRRPRYPRYPRYQYRRRPHSGRWIRRGRYIILIGA